MSLDQHVAVVTGGNGGIGLGIAAALGAAGARVAVWSRNEAKTAHALEQLNAVGITALGCRCDVSVPADVSEAMETTLGEFGKVDSMFANAGIGGGAKFIDLSLEQWRRVISTNLDGTFLCLQAAARHMVERGEGGSLVAVTSTSAIHGAPANEAYSASKAGIGALIRGLAVELARYQIRCNSLMPGWTESDMTEPLKGWEKFVDNTIGRTPARRWGTPADMGAVAVFLADPTLLFHTGDSVVVDGGYTVF